MLSVESQGRFFKQDLKEVSALQLRLCFKHINTAKLEYRLFCQWFQLDLKVDFSQPSSPLPAVFMEKKAKCNPLHPASVCDGDLSEHLSKQCKTAEFNGKATSIPLQEHLARDKNKIILIRVLTSNNKLPLKQSLMWAQLLLFFITSPHLCFAHLCVDCFSFFFFNHTWDFYGISHIQR